MTKKKKLIKSAKKPFETLKEYIAKYIISAIFSNFAKLSKQCWSFGALP